jgi:hypothetical protein
MHPKLYHSPVAPGVARLTADSGLFLLRGGEAGRWLLEGRTWGSPPPELVRQWQVQAIEAARALDRDVPLPERLAG